MKTLHAQRKTHTMFVSIFDKVQKILDKLSEAEPDDLKMYQPFPKLIYPVGKIRVLNKDVTIE